MRTEFCTALWRRAGGRRGLRKQRWVQRAVWGRPAARDALAGARDDFSDLPWLRAPAFCDLNLEITPSTVPWSGRRAQGGIRRLDGCGTQLSTLIYCPPAPPLCCRLTLSQNSFFPSLGQVEGGLRLSCGGQRARQSECKLRFPGGSHSRSSEKRPEVLRCRRRIAGTVPCA